MAGSPKKRARKEAERRRLAAEEAMRGQVEHHNSRPALPAPAPLQEVLPPIKQDELEITRTALKRAMRKRAADFAERAIEVLSKNLDSEDPEVASKAANDLLKWGFGNPATDIEMSKEGGLSIAILRFNDQEHQ